MKQYGQYQLQSLPSSKNRGKDLEEFREWLLTKYIPSVQKDDVIRKQLSPAKHFFGEEYNMKLLPKPKSEPIEKKYLNDPKAGYFSLSEHLKREHLKWE